MYDSRNFQFYGCVVFLIFVGLPLEISIEAQGMLDEMFKVGSLHEVIVAKVSENNVVTIYHPLLALKVKQKLIPLPEISLPSIA